MKKRGISNLIAASLLILIAIMAVFVVYALVKTILESKTDDSGETLACLTEVNLEITNPCYSLDKIKFTVRNNNNFDYDTEFFILRIIKGGRTVDIPTNWHSVLRGFEQKEFIADVSEPEKIENAIFIPKIKEEKGYCYGQGITFIPAPCE